MPRSPGTGGLAPAALRLLLQTLRCHPQLRSPAREVLPARTLARGPVYPSWGLSTRFYHFPSDGGLSSRPDHGHVPRAMLPRDAQTGVSRAAGHGHLRALHCEVTGREDTVTRFLLCRLPGLSGKDWPFPFVRRRWNWGLWKLKPERGISAVGRSTWSLNRDGARSTASERQSQDESPGPPEPPSPGAATQLQAAGGDPPGTGGLGRGGAGGGLPSPAGSRRGRSP